MAEAEIVCDPDILVGKPTIKGTRLSVELVLDFLATGTSQQELLDAYPSLTEEGIQACLAYARDAVARQAMPSAAE